MPGTIPARLERPVTCRTLALLTVVLDVQVRTSDCDYKVILLNLLQKHLKFLEPIVEHDYFIDDVNQFSIANYVYMFVY